VAKVIKKITIRRDPLEFVKETKEDRKERIRNSDLRTRVAKNKKAYNRNDYKRGGRFYDM